MPSRGQSGIATYLAWNTSTNVYETGDAANHTIYFARDGIFSGAQNQTAITELSSAVGAAKGAYQIAWTSAEGTCNVLWVGGNSSTTNVALIPITYTFEQLPVAAPNANNGLITVGSGSGQLTMQSGFADINLVQWLGLPPNSLASGLVVSEANVTEWQGAPVAALVGGSLVQVAVSGLANANVTQWLGVAPAPLSTVQSGYVQATATLAGITSQAQFGVNVVTWEGAVPAPLINALVQTTVSGSVASSTNVTQWAGVSVAPLIAGLVQTTVSGVANANVQQWLGVAPNALQNGLVQSAVLSGLINSNVTQWLGVAPAPLSTVQSGYVQATATLAGITSQAQFGVNVVTWEGAVPAPLINALVQTTVSGSVASSTNVTQWAGVNVAPLIAGLVQTTVSGVANANVQQWLGAAPNALQNGLVQSAMLSGLALANLTQINGAAVNAATAQLGVNAVQIGGVVAATSLAASNVNVVSIAGAAATSSLATNAVNVNQWLGSSVSATAAGIPDVNTKNVGGAAIQQASGIIQSNLIQWEGVAPAPLIATLVQTTASGIATANVTQWLGTAPNPITAAGNVQADVEQWRQATVNTLASGRVDSTIGQVQANAIGTAGFVAGALTTTVFAAPFLTSASYDTSYSNGLADALGNRANAIEVGLTPYQSWQLVAASQGGQLSGAGTTQIGIWGAGVTTTRISAVTDQSGNRSSVTLNL